MTKKTQKKVTDLWYIVLNFVQLFILKRIVAATQYKRYDLVRRLVLRLNENSQYFDRKVRCDGRVSVYYIIITRPGLCEVAITLRRETTRTGDEGRGRRRCAPSYYTSSFSRFFLRKELSNYFIY